MAIVLSSLHPLLQSAEPTVAQKKRFLALPTSSFSQSLLDAIYAVGLQRSRIESLRPSLKQLGKTEVAPLPFITGDDLPPLGLQPGPRYKQILDAVYDGQLENRIHSREQALELAARLISA
jgi:hypothetical protein